MRFKTPASATLAALLVLCALPEAGASAAQHPGLETVAANAVILRTIDPLDADFVDLEPLAELLADVRVVQLGEATHGDGATFEAKARLIRFLHQRLGFDAIAWEAGIYDMRDVDRALDNLEVPLPEAGALGLYSLWWQAREVQPTLQYVRDSRRGAQPIRLVGFDSRVSTADARAQRFPAFVFEFFDRLDPALISAAEREALVTMSVGLVPADYYENPGPRDYDRELPRRLLRVIDERRAELLALYPANDIDYAAQTLRSLLGMDRALEGGQARGAASDGYSRDTAMAENLLWWLNGQLRDRKVIVWAHNYHVQEAGVANAPAERPFAGPHGRFLAEALGNDVYTVGVTSWDGQYGYAADGPVPLPAFPDESMEALLAGIGEPYLWVDMKKPPGAKVLSLPRPAGFMLYDEPLAVADWSRVFDAVLFIRTQHPATPLEGR